MLILILGDSHGRLDLVHQACTEARERYGVEAVIQVGDFGLFPKTLHRFLQEGPRTFPIPVHVIDGNHEDHAWLSDCRGSGEFVEWAGANLQAHRRGSVIDIGGSRIGLLGGALHADRRQEWAGQWSRSGSRRIPHDPHWANWVTEGDCDRALEAFALPLDLLVTHSCPAGIGVGMCGEPSLCDDADRFITRAGFHSGPFTDCGEGSLTRLWHCLPVKPPAWVFGHFHRLHESVVDGTRFVCVGSVDDTDGVRGVRPVIYDTVNRALTLLSDARLAVT